MVSRPLQPGHLLLLSNGKTLTVLGFDEEFEPNETMQYPFTAELGSIRLTQQTSWCAPFAALKSIVGRDCVLLDQDEWISVTGHDGQAEFTIAFPAYEPEERELSCFEELM